MEGFWKGKMFRIPVGPYRNQAEVCEAVGWGWDGGDIGEGHWV
jgi:hypothetical protein